MKQLKRKLRSNAGASMIFALVFLLFCVFIGGSVLAAATANAGRVASMTTDQQEYLSQRSAALVMADMLTETDDAPMQLIIKEVVHSVNGTKTTYTLETGDQSRSVLQRVLIENAVRKYRAAREEGSESFLGFDFVNLSSEYNKDTQHLYSEKVGSFQIKDANGTEMTAWFRFDQYSLKIGFDELDNEGKTVGEPSSQIFLSVNAHDSTGEAIEVQKNETTKTTTTTTIIRWDPPVIEKGGVSDE